MTHPASAFHLDQQAAQRRDGRVHLGRVQRLAGRVLQVHLVAGGQHRLALRGADAAGVADVFGKQEHPPAGGGAQVGTGLHLDEARPHGWRAQAGGIAQEAGRGAVDAVGQATVEVVVAQVQRAGDQAAHIDLRRGPEQDARAVEQGDAAVAGEAAEDGAGCRATADAVERAAVGTGQLEVHAAARADVEALPLVDGAARRLLDAHVAPAAGVGAGLWRGGAGALHPPVGGRHRHGVARRRHRSCCALGQGFQRPHRHQRHHQGRQGRQPAGQGRCVVGAVARGGASHHGQVRS